MSALPHTLYRAAQVREFDRIAIEECGIPGATLMQRAGAAAFDVLRARWPKARSVAVACGEGNNGGDGFVLARLAHEAGLQTRVLQVGDAACLRGDALAAHQALTHNGVCVVPFSAEALRGCDVIVDALFGTGLDRAVSGAWRAAIEAINHAATPVLALDIPSGLHADTGRVLGAAVRATATVSFIALKQGMFTGLGPDHCGAVVFNDLDVPADIFTRAQPSALRLDLTHAPTLAPRSRAAHKGDYGRVLVIGGDHGMAGAARLAAEAAARVGAGLVIIATRAAHAPGLISTRPELLCRGVESAAQLAPLLHEASVIAVGPGLGCGAWASELLTAVLEMRTPLVIDADALNLVALDPRKRDDWVLTPHPGEAARLLGCSAADVQADRFQAVREIQRRYGGVAVLKGAGTLICNGAEPIAVCSAGNPGMASAGMGDVLTGVIAGLRAQGVAASAAAPLGVCLHATAGDLAAREGERGLLAGDLMPHLRRLVNCR